MYFFRSYSYYVYAAYACICLVTLDIQLRLLVYLTFSRKHPAVAFAAEKQW